MGNGRLSGRAAGGSSGSQLGAGTCEHAQAQRTEARRQRVERSIGHGAGSSELGACIRPHLTRPSPRRERRGELVVAYGADQRPNCRTGTYVRM